MMLTHILIGAGVLVVLALVIALHVLERQDIDG